MIRVLIVDDHPVIRRGLRDIVTDQPDMEVGAEATNAAQALELVRKQHWDAVIMDITMPGRSGLEALHDIRGEKPQLPVLMLSIHSEEQYAMRALKAGASGYLTKESAPDELVNAIHKVVTGGLYVSANMAERLAAELRAPAGRSAHELLSDREFEVLCLMGRGKSVSQVATELSLSVKTVSTYRANILQKLGLENTAEIIRYAITHNLVE